MQFDLDLFQNDTTPMTAEQKEFYRDYFDGELFSQCRHPLYFGFMFETAASVQFVMNVIDEKQALARECLEGKAYWDHIMLYERPYRLGAALAIFDDVFDLPPKAYWEFVDNLWTDSEQPCVHANNRMVWQMFFEEYDGKSTDHLSEEDKALFDALPDMVTVYRGGHREGFSWTTKKDKACWFARRFKEPQPCWQGVIAKDQINWFSNSRWESEVVITRPEQIKNVVKLEI